MPSLIHSFLDQHSHSSQQEFRSLWFLDSNYSINASGKGELVSIHTSIDTFISCTSQVPTPTSIGFKAPRQIQAVPPVQTQHYELWPTGSSPGEGDRHHEVIPTPQHSWKAENRARLAPEQLNHPSQQRQQHGQTCQGKPGGQNRNCDERGSASYEPARLLSVVL